MNKNENAVQFELNEGMELAPISRNMPPAYEMYPLNDMPVGSSFFVPESVKAPLTVAAHVREYKKAKAAELGCTVDDLGVEFKTRKRTEDGVKGIRVWRTK